jgi:hypothetical protein
MTRPKFYIDNVDQNNKEIKKAKKVIKGLLEVASIAMPDSFFMSDKRTQKALDWLERNK